MNLYYNNAFAKQPLPEVVREMQPFLRDEFENPLTESEGAGIARDALQSSRKRIAELLHATPVEIICVSSGTEANNWALKGAIAASRKARKHIVLSAIEHFSVYQTALFLKKQGVEVTIIPVDREGRIEIADVERAIVPETVLVSIISGSDEIGVTQDLAALSGLKLRYPEVLFHTDAIQYVCYEELDLRALQFDLVSISSNALYGPAGIAALYIREGTRMVPLLHGGMQEEGLRPGLQSIALVAGFGEAARACRENRHLWREHVLTARDQLFHFLDDARVPLTGSRKHRLADNVHAIVDVDGEALLTLLQAEGIRASTGSTCYQYAQKESHVLAALGLDRDIARGSVLFTASIYQTKEDAAKLTECLADSLRNLRRLKP